MAGERRRTGVRRYVREWAETRFGMENALSPHSIAEQLAVPTHFFTNRALFPALHKMRKPLPLLVVISAFACFLPTENLLAQRVRDSLFEAIHAEMEPLLARQGEPALPLDFTAAYGATQVDALLNVKDPSLEPVSKDALFDLEIQSLKNDWGLSVRSQFYHQFDDFAAPGEIDETDYPTRMRLGLEWDVLQGGYFANRNKIKRLENEKEIEWLKFDQARNRERLFFRRMALNYHFNREKIKVLEKRRATLTQELGMLNRIYFLRDLMFEEIIARRSKLQQVQVQLDNLLAFNALAERTLDLEKVPLEIEVDRLPMLQLDVERLLEDSTFRQANDQVLRLMQENSLLKNQPGNDISLNVQLNQNFVLGVPEAPSRTFPSIGVGMKFPVESFFRQDLPEQHYLAEKLELERQNQYARLNVLTEIVNLHYEYNYKLKQYVEFTYKYLLSQERMRVEQVFKANFNDFYQPFQVLKHYDDLREIRLELLDLKLQTYELLLAIYSKTNLKSLRPYLQTFSFQQYVNRLPGNRMIFVSANDFRRHERQFIQHYLIFNDFEYAVVKDADWFDPKLLPQSGEASGVRFLKTVTWNPADTAAARAGAMLAIQLAKQGYGGAVIHFGHEILSRNLPAQAERLGRFVAAFRKVEPEMPLMLSLPAGFPLKWVAGGKAFEKYVLRAGTVQELQAWGEAMRSLPPFERFPACLSLDVRQFKDRLKLEGYVGQMMTEFQLEDVALDDFGAMVEMEIGN